MRENNNKIKGANMDTLKCDYCETEDSAMTPVHPIVNAGHYESLTNVCSDCASMYDGTFGRDENGNVIFI
jgi:hypothetical protein